MANQKNSSQQSSKTEKSRKALAAEVKTLEEKLAAMEADLEKARADLKEKSDTTGVEQELEELKLANEKLSEENEALKGRLKKAEDEAARQAETSTSETQEAERQRQRFENEMQQMEGTIKALEQKLHSAEQPREALQENLSAPRSTFRIDLYPRQGHYQGRIEHTLTKDKKVFTDLDQAAIIEFISSHLPKLGERPAERRPATAPAGPSAAGTAGTITQPEFGGEPAATATAMEPETALNIGPIHVFQPVGSWQPTLTLSASEEFSVQTTFRLSTPETQKLTTEQAPFRVSWYIHRLAAGGYEALESVEGNLSPNRLEYTAEADIEGLEPGIYRLTTLVALPTAQNLMTYDEGLLLHVN